MARSHLSSVREIVDNMDTGNAGAMKAAQAKLKEQLDRAEAAHQEEMKVLEQRAQTAQDQSGSRVVGPAGLEGDDLDEFMQEAQDRRMERLKNAPLSEGELQALQDPLYQQGGSVVDPFDPRPLQSPLEAAANSPTMALSRARRF
jgi:hypothetical protein